MDQVLDFGGDVEDAQARLEGVDRFVNVLADSARVQERFFLRRGWVELMSVFRCARVERGVCV